MNDLKKPYQEIQAKILNRIGELEDVLNDLRARLPTETNILNRKRLEQDEKQIVKEISRLIQDYETVDVNEKYSETGNSLIEFIFRWGAGSLSIFLGFLFVQKTGKYLIIAGIVLLLYEVYLKNKSNLHKFILTISYFMSIYILYLTYINSNLFGQVLENIINVKSGNEFYIDNDESTKAEAFFNPEMFLYLIQGLGILIIIFSIVRILSLIKSIIHND
jgi:hypothetical protein